MADEKDDKKKAKEGGEKAPKEPKEPKAEAKGEAKAAKPEKGGEKAAKGGEKAAKGGEKGGKGKKEAAPAQEYKRTAPPRLKAFYAKEIVPRMMKEFKYSNVMEVPRLTKITVNMGLGEAVQNP